MKTKELTSKQIVSLRLPYLWSGDRRSLRTQLGCSAHRAVEMKLSGRSLSTPLPAVACSISNHRLLALADGQVTFRWRDSADHNRQKVMTLARDEFLRRFLLHLLPKGFVRIRHFGFLANRSRAALLPLCFRALHALPPQAESEPSTASTTQPRWRCPKCGGPMVVVERFTAAQLQLRSPPALATAA
jgi:hypothetical protein